MFCSLYRNLCKILTSFLNRNWINNNSKEMTRLFNSNNSSSRIVFRIVMGLMSNLNNSSNRGNNTTGLTNNSSNNCNLSNNNNNRINTTNRN